MLSYNNFFNKIPKISIGVLFFLNAGIVSASEVSLKSPDLLQHNVVYKKNLINDLLYFAQDPLPLCYSVTSNIMLDVKFCELNPKLCNKRSSFLETNMLGVKNRDSNISLNMDGGNYERIFDAVKERGYLVSQNSCNYNNITDNLSWYTEPAFKEKMKKIKSHYDRYHKYKKYSKYYSEYAKNQFKYILAEVKVEEDKALEMIEEKDFQRVLERMTFDPNCSKPEKYKTPKNFKINYWKSKSEDYSKIAKESQSKILSVLKKGELVGISFCLEKEVNSSKDEDTCPGAHSLVISGYAELVEKGDVTNKKKIAYYVVNSWGEVWQKKTGGLIWADNLHKYVYNGISWLE